MSQKRLIGWLVGLSLLSGCGSVERRQQADILETTLYSYSNNIRWGNLQQAYLFLSPTVTKDIQVPPGLEEVRVVSYDVVGSVQQTSESTATQNVRIGYYRVGQPSLRTIMDRQTWTYDPEAKTWYLGSDIPSFR